MSIPVLNTPRLRLDELQSGDAPRLNAIRNDEETKRYLGERPHEPLSRTRSLIDTMASNNAAQSSYNWAVRLRGGELIGVAGVWKIDRASGRGELGYLVAPLHWNQGYATEALAALFECLDEEEPNLRVDAMVDLRNEYSIRLLDRHRFELSPPRGDEDPSCRWYVRAAVAPASP